MTPSRTTVYLGMYPLPYYCLPGGCTHPVLPGCVMDVPHAVLRGGTWVGTPPSRSTRCVCRSAPVSVDPVCAGCRPVSVVPCRSGHCGAGTCLAGSRKRTFHWTIWSKKRPFPWLLRAGRRKALRASPAHANVDFGCPGTHKTAKKEHILGSKYRLKARTQRRDLSSKTAVSRVPRVLKQRECALFRVGCACVTYLSGSGVPFFAGPDTC